MSGAYYSILNVGVPAAADLDAARFVGFDGNYPSPGGVALGVTRSSVTTGERVPVDVVGFVPVIAGGPLSPGDPVEAGPDGKAVIQTSGQLCGRVMPEFSAAGDGDSIQILLTVTS